jgi:hypothetical protein
MRAALHSLGRAWVLGLTALTLVSGCSSNSNDGGTAGVDHIAVTPVSSSIAAGETTALTATLYYTDGSSANITDDAEWASANSSVATVTNSAPARGIVSGISSGSTTVTATFAGFSGTAVVNVVGATLTSFEVTPVSASTAVGTTLPFKATAIYSDSSTQDVTEQTTWASADTNVATISNADGTRGRATGVAEGTVIVTASYQGRTDSATLSVTPVVLSGVYITPLNPEIPNGRTQQFSLIGVFSDGTYQDLTSDASWASGDSGILGVSNADGSKGLAAGQTVGETTISATFEDMSGSTTVKVTDAVMTSIQVAPANSKVAVGFERPFTATGLFSDNTHRDVTTEVIWSTSDTAIATVSNATGTQGVATGVAAGAVGITAQSGSLSTSVVMTVTSATLSSIGVTPASVTLPKGLTQALTATGTFSDGTTQDLTTQVTWSSSDAATASVSNADGSQGVVTAADPGGPVDITATRDAVSGSSSVTVTDAAVQSIAVTPATATAPKGETQQYTAMGTFTDGSVQDITTAVTWSSSDTAVAQVSNAGGSNGLATALEVGSATVRALDTATSVFGTAAFNVTAEELVSIAVAPAATDVVNGRSTQFTASGTYTDGSVRDVTTQVQWTSADETIATVSNAAGTNGLATGTGEGMVTITATAPGSTITDSADLTVTAAELDSVTVEPADPSVPAGLSVQLTATGHYSNGTTQDLTGSVTWSSSNTSVAEVSNSGGSQGLVLAKNPGTTTITALDPGTMKSGSQVVTVTAAQLQAIEVQSTDARKVAIGYSLQHRAIGSFSNGQQIDITQYVSWSTISTAVATVGNSDADKGLATGVAAGTTTVVATYFSKTGTRTLTVIPGALASISVSPVDSSFGPGETKQFTALGNFDDGGSTLVVDITRDVTWSSSNTGVATISNAAGSEGLATASSDLLGSGTTTITATASGKSASTSLTRTVL